MFIRKVNKKAIAVIVAVCMAMCYLPAIVMADDGSERLARELAAAEDGAVITLDRDAQLESILSISGGNEETPVTIVIQKGVTLTLKENVGIDGCVIFTGGGTVKRGTRGDLLTVGAEGELRLSDITIDGSAADGENAEGAVIAVAGGRLDLCDTVIKNNFTDRKSAVYLDGTVTLSGQTEICENTAQESASANVFVGNGSRIQVEGRILGSIFIDTDIPNGGTMVCGAEEYAMTAEDAAVFTMEKERGLVWNEDKKILTVAKRSDVPEFLNKDAEPDVQNGRAAAEFELSEAFLDANAVSDGVFRAYGKDAAEEALGIRAVLKESAVVLELEQIPKETASYEITYTGVGEAESDRAEISVVPFTETTQSEPDNMIAVNGEEALDDSAGSGAEETDESVPVEPVREKQTEQRTARSAFDNELVIVLPTSLEEYRRDAEEGESGMEAESESRVSADVDDWDLEEDSEDDEFFDEEDDGSAVQTGDTSLIYIWYLSVIALCALSVFIVLFRCTAMYEMIKRKLWKK